MLHSLNSLVFSSVLHELNNTNAFKTLSACKKEKHKYCKEHLKRCPFCDYKGDTACRKGWRQYRAHVVRAGVPKLIKIVWQWSFMSNIFHIKYFSSLYIKNLDLHMLKVLCGVLWGLVYSGSHLWRGILLPHTDSIMRRAPSLDGALWFSLLKGCVFLAWRLGKASRHSLIALPTGGLAVGLCACPSASLA